MLEYKKIFQKILDDSFKHISALGSYQIYLIITVFFLIIGKINEFLFLFIGFLLIKLLIVPIRIIFFKQRPDKEKYSNIFEKASAASFPSLHSTRTTFLIFFLINYFHYNIQISLYFISIGTLILYSRIYLKRHYIIDVIVGVILGGLFYYLTKMFF